MQFANQPQPEKPNAPAETGPSARTERPRVEHQESNVDLLVMCRVLLLHWWVIAPVVLLGVLYGMFRCLHSRPYYQASCRLEIIYNRPVRVVEDPDAMAYAGGLSRHVVLLQSGKLNQQVRENLAPKWKKRLDSLWGSLRIVPAAQSAATMLDLSVESLNYEYSLEYLNELLKVYEETRKKESGELVENAAASLRSEVTRLSKEMEQAEAELDGFEKEHNLGYLEKKRAADELLLAGLMKQYTEYRTQRTIIDSQLPLLRQAEAPVLDDILEMGLRNIIGNIELLSEARATAPQVLPTAARPGMALPPPPAATPTMTAGGPQFVVNRGDGQHTNWADRRVQIEQLKTEYQSKLDLYQEGHPLMQALKARIQSAERELQLATVIALKRVEARRDALLMQENAFLKRAQEFKEELSVTASEQVTHDRLKQRVAGLRQLHDAVYFRVVGISENMPNVFFTRMVEDPTTSTTPVRPNKPKIMAATTLGGLAAGVALALALYFIRVGIYDFSKIEERYNLRCLASVPKIQRRRLQASPVVVSQDLKNVISESYRNLRTQLEASFAGKGHRVLLVSSPEPGEGKTLCSLNLAHVLAWNLGRVLLIDGDLRKMGMRDYFPNAPKDGLSDLLSSPDRDWRSCIVKTEVPALDYLPAGHSLPDAAELLGKPRLAELCAAFRQEYDCIVVDSAPVNRVVDPILIGKQADALLLIVSSGSTTASSFQYCLSRIATVPLVGYVLNKVDHASGYYAYHYYGSHYYRGHYYYHSYYYYGKDGAKRKRRSAAPVPAAGAAAEPAAESESDADS